MRPERLRADGLVRCGTPLLILFYRDDCFSNRIRSRDEFDLAGMRRFNSRSAPPLDPASNPNSLAFQGLKVNSGGLERRHSAP